MHTTRILNLEIRDEASIDSQLPYAVYDHDHYTGNVKMNYPVLIARFNNTVAAHEWANSVVGIDDEEPDQDDFDDSMDGDFDSGMASAGFGTDEDYGCYGDDY